MSKKRKLPQIVKDLRKKVETIRIDYSKYKYISFSQYQVYRKCPHLWYLQSVAKKLPFTQNIYVVFGSAIHTVLQNYLEVYYNYSAREANKLDLHQMLEDELKKEYLKAVKKNKNKHFSNSTELTEYLEDGINIINYFLKNKSEYFSRKETYLVGNEIPISIKIRENLYFQGFLDVVLYNDILKRIKIIDLKSSTKGWSKWDKNDKVKHQQVLLYKRYFSKLYGIPEEDIEVEFVILKRKINKNSEYPAMKRHFQGFIPTNGKNTMNKAEREFLQFIDNAFDEEGKPIIKKYPYNTKSCKFCVANNQPDLCSINGKVKLKDNFFSY